MADTDFGGNEIDTSGTSVHAGAVQTAASVSGGVLWLYGPLSCNGACVAEGVPTYAQSTNGLSQWRVSFARGVANGSSPNYLNRISRTSPVGNAMLVPDLNDSLVMMAPPKAGVDEREEQERIREGYLCVDSSEPNGAFRQHGIWPFLQ